MGSSAAADGASQPSSPPSTTNSSPFGSQSHLNNEQLLQNILQGRRGVESGRNDFNQILLLEAHRQHETYEEMKRLLIFACVFFLFAIAFVLMRFQVSIEEVIRWSPVIWLLGIVACGLLLNLALLFRRFLLAREAKRERERHTYLHSIRLPGSFPCLAPPGSNCCHRQRQVEERNRLIRARERPAAHNCLANCPVSISNVNLPNYDQIGQFPLLSPPALVIQRPKMEKPPPKYVENTVEAQSQASLGNASDEQPPPDYEL